MTVAITGLTLTPNSQGNVPNAGYVQFVGYGTYTAANFIITPEDGLGFTPTKVHWVNLTDFKEVTYYVNSNLGTSNAEGLLVINHATVQAGYTAAGISVSTSKVAVTFDVSEGPTITDNDDFIIEFWA